MDPTLLPTLNAGLNATAAMLLIRGRWLARQGRVDAHRRCMLWAFATSAAFLASYVVHKGVLGFESVEFGGEGMLRSAYLMLLFSHVVLAVAVPPLAIALITLALRGRFEQHRRLARIAWPIWIYVSLTGVCIYWILY